MGYRLNRLDEPVFIAVSKPLLTEFGIHYRLESCDTHYKVSHGFVCSMFIDLLLHPSIACPRHNFKPAFGGVITQERTRHNSSLSMEI